jgi:hypothetical protein
MIVATARPIRAAEISIGGRYLVAGGATVRIDKWVASCIWLATNEATGKRRYVLFGDIIRECEPPRVDRRRLAAGDVD